MSRTSGCCVEAVEGLKRIGPGGGVALGLVVFRAFAGPKGGCRTQARWA